MEGIPLQAIIAPIIGVAVMLYFLARRRSVAGAQDQQHASYRVGALAQRLGLTVTEGDPEFNVFIRQANVDVRRGPADRRPIQIQVRMAGAPHGVPLELVYRYRVEQRTGLAQVIWHTWFDCRMTAESKRPFPPFEVISRQAPLGPIAATQPLPAAPTGRADIDGAYAITTGEPTMAEVLARALPSFATFANSGVHLVGDGRSISFVMKQDKAPLLANALYYAEPMAAELSALARTIGG